VWVFNAEELMADDPLILVFIPALAPLLVRAEDLKGSPLTEEQIATRK
jgi:hypothetical protein